jgi:hypothetical protein
VCGTQHGQIFVYSSVTLGAISITIWQYLHVKAGVRQYRYLGAKKLLPGTQVVPDALFKCLIWLIFIFYQQGRQKLNALSFILAI